MTTFDEATAVTRRAEGLYDVLPDARFAIVAPGGSTPSPECECRDWLGLSSQAAINEAAAPAPSPSRARRRNASRLVSNPST